MLTAPVNFVCALRLGSGRGRCWGLLDFGILLKFVEKTPNIVEQAAILPSRDGTNGNFEAFSLIST